MQKTGNKSCSYGQSIVIRSKGNGTITHYAPSSRFRNQWYHGAATLFVDTTTVSTNSTSWKVTATNGVLDDDQTYASCVPAPSQPQ